MKNRARLARTSLKHQNKRSYQECDKKRSFVRGEPEHELQSAAVDYMEENYPNVLHTASMTGVYLRPITRKKCQEKGVRPGYPDWRIYKANGGYFGLEIEFKAPGKKVKPKSNQENVLFGLHQEGYCVRVINTLENAIKTIDWYMSLSKTEVKQ